VEPVRKGKSRSLSVSGYLPLEIMCPRCHRLFTRELEKKEFVNHDFAMVQGEPSALEGAIKANASRPYYVRKEFSRYRYHYRCKHCGHEWTELRTEITDA